MPLGRLGAPLNISGVVTTAVGYHLAIGHPHEPAPIAWTAVILGGPALFTIGRARFEHEVFSRVSRSRAGALLALAALFPLMIRRPPLAALAATAAVLAAAALADTRRTRGVHPNLVLYATCILRPVKRFSQAVRVWYAKRRRSRRLTVVLAAFVVFLGVVLTAQLTPGRSPVTAPSPGESANGARNSGDFMLVRRDPNDAMAVGNVDAPVVLVQWTDMRCPYCAVFNRETLPTLLREYVQTGKVRLEVHDVAYFGEQSTDGAVAARAAGNQGKFFEYLSTVYKDVPDGVHPDLPRERLIAYARKAGVPDIERFTAELTDADLRAAAQDSHATAEQLGVTSVPFFVAGDTVLAGAQPIEVFRKFLDDAIAKAR